MTNVNGKRRKVMMKGEIRCNEYTGIAMSICRRIAREAECFSFLLECWSLIGEAKEALRRHILKASRSERESKR